MTALSHYTLPPFGRQRGVSKVPFLSFAGRRIPYIEMQGRERTHVLRKGKELSPYWGYDPALPQNTEAGSMIKECLLPKAGDMKEQYPSLRRKQRTGPTSFA